MCHRCRAKSGLCGCYGGVANERGSALRQSSGPMGQANQILMRYVVLRLCKCIAIVRCMVCVSWRLFARIQDGKIDEDSFVILSDEAKELASQMMKMEEALREEVMQWNSTLVCP